MKSTEYHVLECEIKNPFGLHARPSTMFVERSMKYPNDIRLARGEDEASGKSVLGLLGLAVECGEMVKIKISKEEGNYERIGEELKEVFSIEYVR